MSGHVLKVSDLSVVAARRPEHDLLHRIYLEIERGQTLALVGESGSGKSLTALAILGLLERELRIRSGRIELGGHDLLTLDAKARRDVLGRRIGIIFQDPGAALNPHHRIDAALIEVLVHRGGLDRRRAREQARALLLECGLTEVDRILGSHPHQLSGGQRQRVMIALALALDPELLIADEPTTALDVSTQARIMLLLHEIQEQRGLSMLFISHDLGLVERCADEVALIYQGRIVERASCADFFAGPRHPYGRLLLESCPRLDGAEPPRAPVAAEDRTSSLAEGCRFAARCHLVRPDCRLAEPPLVPVAPRHLLACPVVEQEDDR